jgi:hypothetical protein
VQQSPLPFDPARQQFTPPQPVVSPSPPRPAEVPVQATATPKDKFSKNQGDQGDDSGKAYDNQQQAATAGKLRAAYLRLTELQREAAAALNAGNAKRAKEVAQEAAEVAQSIHAQTSAMPISDLGAIEVQADQMIASSSSGGSAAAPASSGSSTGSTVTITVSGVIDLARDGLGTAKDVVDTASMLPQHPIEDRIALSGMRQTVLAAMAGVEAIAAKVAEQAAQGSASKASNRIDIRT